jgi:hypothetical protein
LEDSGQADPDARIRESACIEDALSERIFFGLEPSSEFKNIAAKSKGNDDDRRYPSKK